ncbi:hypothetical protein KC343_g10570 [Hortaea werneckii]|nr:hypothetical protein KC352_g18059 [Hortaea werneckii]KAI7561883.1 hypothetical protein KC317_g8785 [Hortaea werneckii]KAI7606614.1 hypothetical protein KC346_g10452 [Hortaea werneckii]KAI7614278.1 hypothetical protein KC343_g10570 [Hortaea werneckii]KAI7650325.1 hypothetical protein KC319_g11081 [Hortaea werneckii]
MDVFRTTLSKRPHASRSKLPSLRNYRALNSSTAQNLPQKRDGSDNEDFYRYTSGRWLWNEESRLQERYKKFNVPGLKSLAAKASGAQSCISMVRLAEGGFNKVFRLDMDNGEVMMARIPTPVVGPISQALASEVATMDFARNVLDIPVPKVIAWDGKTANAAGCEFILMEQAKGKSLAAIWPDMELEEKFKIVEEVVAIQKKLQSVAFSSYGTLYYKSDAAGYSSSIDIDGSLPPSAKMYAKYRFVVGPLAERSFWEPEHAGPAIDRGPWPSAQSYLRAISQRERSKCPLKDAPADPQDDSDLLDSPQARLSLLHKFGAVSAYLPPSQQSLNRGTLFHWDLRAPNLFIEDGRITSLIDWQDVWIAPLFMQERGPQLLEYDGETIPLRECLYQLQRQWNKLNTNIACPIHFSTQEIEAHEEASSDWDERAKFWDSLSGFVSQDGYTSLETYEEARKLFKELREEGRHSLSGKELAEFEIQSKWVERLG